MIGLIGHRGYIGSEIKESLKRKSIDFVLLERDFNEKILVKLGVKEIINAAGYTGKPNVDACEVDKYDCIQGNIILPLKLINICERLNIKLGHVSSGCVYQGDNNGKGYKEDDLPNFDFKSNNYSFYSGCKSIGEEFFKENCYVWRLRIPFNHIDNPRNYLSKLLRYECLLNARNSLSHLNEFADACVQSFIDNMPTGIYNLTNPGSITTKEVVNMMHKTIAKDREFSFFENEDSFLSTVATPRSNCVLDSSKALSVGLKLSPIRDAIEKSLLYWND